MSTFQGTDNCTDIILDFIAEGESNGNYNAVIGEVNSQASLATLTLNYITQKLMPGLLTKHPSLNSTAVGRYQLIRKTFLACQASCGFVGNVMFSPKVQDEMAVVLLKGRGYQSWWLGHMNDEVFAHNLSMEWASLPDPDNGGRSHYDGVGPNHAGTTLAKVYTMLAAARAAKPRA